VCFDNDMTQQETLTSQLAAAQRLLAEELATGTQEEQLAALRATWQIERELAALTGTETTATLTRR